MKPRLLMVTAQGSVLAGYAGFLREAGYEVQSVPTAVRGLATLNVTSPATILVDLHLPEGNAVSLIRDIRARHGDVPVLAIAPDASVSRVIDAMRAGAHDLLVQPIEEAQIMQSLTIMTGGPERALVGTAAHRVALEPAPSGFVGRSTAMRDVYARMRLAAGSSAPVFITGECGTGKELCAETIHRLSDRSGGPFVALNCGAIAPELIASDLFGHIRGAYPGALSDKPGAAALADGGTLFLNEICALDAGLQARLLRFVETSAIQPLGAADPRKVDVRVICASRPDPAEAVRTGQFREDLFYQLDVVPIRMPPLRDREDDAAEIAERALPIIAAEENRRFIGLDSSMRAVLPTLPWPGNVRQLLNVLRQIVVMNDATLVTAAMLPAELRRVDMPETPPAPTARGLALDDLAGKSLAEIEQLVIEATIARQNGSITRAARVLDVAPSTIYRKMGSWGSPTPH